MQMLRRSRWILGGILSAALCALAWQSDAVSFQAAIQKEVVDGDLMGAIGLYESVSRSSDRQIAAKALVRMGRCYEKLGDPRAIEAYERVVRDFGDQRDAVRDASARLAALRPAAESGGAVGWYNGDWQSGIPGLSNWYLSEKESERVYDDFVAPRGGWTVIAVYSNNRMDFTGVTHAAWEIRSGLENGKAGKRVAGGLSPATQTPIPGNGPFPRDPMIGYRIQVDGLQVRLSPGRYWLSVAPVGMGKSYINATRGRSGIGDPPGNNGRAFFLGYAPGAAYPVGVFMEAERIGRPGQFGIGKDFSQGVMIVPPK